MIFRSHFRKFVEKRLSFETASIDNYNDNEAKEIV